MTVTLTRGATTITPLLMDADAETTRTAGTIAHDLIGGGVVVTVMPPRARRGSRTWVFSTAAAAFACEQLIETGAPFQITDTLVPTLNMRASVVGEITRAKVSARWWAVTAEVVEVPA